MNAARFRLMKRERSSSISGGMTTARRSGPPSRPVTSRARRSIVCSSRNRCADHPPGPCRMPDHAAYRGLRPASRQRRFEILRDMPRHDSGGALRNVSTRRCVLDGDRPSRSLTKRHPRSDRSPPCRTCRHVGDEFVALLRPLRSASRRPAHDREAGGIDGELFIDERQVKWCRPRTATSRWCSMSYALYPAHDHRRQSRLRPAPARVPGDDRPTGERRRGDARIDRTARPQAHLRRAASASVSRSAARSCAIRRCSVRRAAVQSRRRAAPEHPRRDRYASIAAPAPP